MKILESKCQKQAMIELNKKYNFLFAAPKYNFGVPEYFLSATVLSLHHIWCI